MMYLGADPGGLRCFGVATLDDTGAFTSACLSSVEDAVGFLPAGVALGIDCPMWWSAAAGGGRSADEWLRRTYKIHPGTVQSANSLKGAVLTQGILLAMRMRARLPDIEITEAHPKALLKALDLTDWNAVCARFGLVGGLPPTEHERDAVLAAVAAREGFTGRWSVDLATNRSNSEQNPKESWFGPVSYWWPEPRSRP